MCKNQLFPVKTRSSNWKIIALSNPYQMVHMGLGLSISVMELARIACIYTSYSFHSLRQICVCGVAVCLFFLFIFCYFHHLIQRSGRRVLWSNDHHHHSLISLTANAPNRIYMLNLLYTSVCYHLASRSHCSVNSNSLGNITV